MDESVKTFWEKDNFKNIKPTNKEFPEGFNPGVIINKLLEGIQYETIVDFGCGWGRLCKGFSKEKYIGTDISDKAIKKAKDMNPDYKFISYSKPKADIYLSYTVFLHLTDNQIREELKDIQTTYFIIAEILGEEWANKGKGTPPTYNRDDYSIMEEFGYSLIKEIKLPYKRYVETKIAEGKNTNISFLLWKNL